MLRYYLEALFYMGLGSAIGYAGSQIMLGAWG